MPIEVRSKKFQERYRNDLGFKFLFFFVGFGTILAIAIGYSMFMIIGQEHNNNFFYSVIIGDIIKVIFSFGLAWFLRGIYLASIDYIISKMDLYEMKILNTSLQHEIELIENSNIHDNEELIEKIEKIKNNGKK